MKKKLEISGGENEKRNMEREKIKESIEREKKKGK